ncbi:MAG: ketopantoate reductase family protein, partial [Steroidobacteraceae bacterium]
MTSNSAVSGRNLDTPRPSWPRIAVVGAGAVGGYFGGLLALAGAPVVMIGRQAFVDAVATSGLLLDTLQFQKTVRVEVSTEMAAVRGADLVLFCVKTADTLTTARQLAPFLGPEAVVLSLQNGVGNAEQIATAVKVNVLSAVVYVAASKPAPAHVKHVGRGDLILGPECDDTRDIAETFAHAGISCRISGNIEGELWVKLISNCALNAISALGQARYGEIAESSDARRLVQTLVEEVFAVARAARIELPGLEHPPDALASAMQIATQMPQARSSTAQDISRRKQTEIDSLNGYIASRGAELGV